jgi:hypothetical protein
MGYVGCAARGRHQLPRALHRPAAWLDPCASSQPQPESHQMPASHAYVQYALLTLLVILFRIDPPSAQAVTAALPLWEVIARPTPAH